MDLFQSIGIDGSYLIIGALAGILVLLVFCILLLKQNKKWRKKYEKFMEGADGLSLEQAVLHRFEEIDGLKKETAEAKESIKNITEHLKSAYQKVGIVKYDAFKEMGGKLSFSLCMLDELNNGFLITSMHSTREGCYTYIKEIIRGESFVLLSEEEKEALDQAKSKNA